jgi:hypothetical protein
MTAHRKGSRGTPIGTRTPTPVADTKHSRKSKRSRNADGTVLQSVIATDTAHAAGTPVPLSAWISLGRRYTRSVNVERDFGSAEALQGYLLTPRGAVALDRCLAALDPEQTARALTLTGVYGTGKSAFAQFLTALAGPAGSPERRLAEGILAEHAAAVSGGPHHAEERAMLPQMVAARMPRSGLLRAVATARHEPLAATVARALARAVDEQERSRARKPLRGPKGREGRGQTVNLLREVRSMAAAAAHGDPIDGARLPVLAGLLADEFGAGLLLVIDELGKALEYAGENRANADVYLLQQLAEAATSPNGYPVAFVGLLHQTFAEYGAALAMAERTEWQKVQGRFEDVPFTEAPENMLPLVRNAIKHDREPEQFARTRRALGRAWHERLRRDLHDPYVASVLTPDVAADVYPLHPVAALALPALCTKYAQNDRSLFTFLTSSEPSAFARFLRERVATPEEIPTHRLAALYDYFVNVAGHALAFRPQFQRWAEVHGVIADARALDPDLLNALKTIGALNLIAASGALRASRGLVLAALASHPDDSAETARWTRVLEQLEARHLVTFRPQLDEYRVWEGSDFDIDAALQEHVRGDARRLAAMLEALAPSAPVVAQRHSFTTGTLRYFERQFVEDADALSKATCTLSDSDGLILYWVGAAAPCTPPRSTTDGRPIVLVATPAIAALRGAASELAGLRAVAKSSPQLQSDGVARREVRARMSMAEHELAHAVRTAFDVRRCRVWVGGVEEKLTEARLNARLSSLCDETYSRGLHLWNELINRRELTSNGARARREVIQAMLTRGSQPRLGIEGDGPEASLYESVLRATGIHREIDASGVWGFTRPTHPGVQPLWEAIDQFCTGATVAPRTLDELLTRLDAPPYGIKRGVVPIVLAAVLLVHTDDVSVYYEGSFVPMLGPEHFEILLRQPRLFAVKHFELTGLRWQIFRELETVVRQGDGQRIAGHNPTLLGVVRPLVRFATGLPRSTRNTTALSAMALAVRDALLTAREPDVLLFDVLPRACGLSPLFDGEPRGEDLPQAEQAKGVSQSVAGTFRKALLAALRELDGAYERLLERCAALMHEAFALKADKTHLRDDLRARAQYLVEGTLDRGLRSFVVAAVNDAASEREWLEALLMIVADRPADTWTDDDSAGFEMKLSDMARRFRNFERLIQEATDASRDGFDARRVTITRGDGSEIHKLVWIDEHARELIARVLSDIRGHIASLSAEQQWAVAAAVTEAVFTGDGARDRSMIGEAGGAEQTADSMAARRLRGAGEKGAKRA